MPLPTPRTDENKDNFISRCMSELNEEFPDEAQRSAVCQSQWENDKVDNVNKFEIKAKSNEAIIYLYGEIGDEWGGITDIEFAKELTLLNSVKKIILRVDSFGGNVFQGITIYNLLKQHPAIVESKIDGIAASISSVIPLAGNTIEMGEGSTYMIHNPHAFGAGEADDFRELADILDMQRDNIVNIYARKTGLGIEKLKSLMKESTWMRGAQALDFGFVDSLYEDMNIAAKIDSELAKQFANIPDHIQIKNGKHNIHAVSTAKLLEDAERAGLRSWKEKSADRPNYRKLQDKMAHIDQALRKYKL